MREREEGRFGLGGAFLGVIGGVLSLKGSTEEHIQQWANNPPSTKRRIENYQHHCQPPNCHRHFASYYFPGGCSRISYFLSFIGALTKLREALSQPAGDAEKNVAIIEERGHANAYGANLS